MASIITNRLRKSIAQSIYDDIFSRRNNYYYYFGKPADNVSLETTPLSTREYEGKVRRNMVAAKKIYSNDVAFVVPRFDWASGQVYDKVTIMDTGYIHPVNGPRFYVYDSQNYRVYKCIDNNDGASSTVRPTLTSANNFTTADGYTWKYLYTIPAGLRSKFLTASYLPVFNSLQKRYYSDGGVNEFTIIKAGSGYSQATTSISVIGDGSGAILEPVIYNGQLGDIIVKNPGRDYTKATIVVNSTQSGQGAEVVADLTVGDLDSDQALVELLSTPGTIDSVDVLTIGTEYVESGTTFKVIGDGTGATVSGVFDGANRIVGINVLTSGSNYSWAEIVVTPQVNPSRSSAAVNVVTRVNVSPYIGHGRNVIEELDANTLMFFGTVFTDRLSDFDVVATYKQHGLIKNIRNYDYSPNIHDQVSPNRYQLEADFGPIVQFYGGGGQGAIGRVNITGQTLRAVTLENGGSGFKSAPNVTFSSGSAAATAIISAKLDSADKTITYSGVGYYSPPAVILSSTTGSGGSLTSTITGGVGAIDITNQGSGYSNDPNNPPTVTITPNGSGSGATAVAQVSNGKIVRILVTNPGSGYNNVPSVSFSGGGGAAATAVLTKTVGSLTVDTTGSNYQTPPVIDFRGSTGISKIEVLDPGELFTSNPSIVIYGGGGNGATAEAFYESCVRSIRLTSAGSGYTTAPTVTISGTGSSAYATAVISGGRVTDINIVSRGYGFASTPIVQIGTQWAATTAVSLNQQLFYGANLYTVTVAGTTSSTAPTSTDPLTPFSNGTATLVYVGSAAKAVATHGSGIVAINITNAGSGYTSEPSIIVNGGGASRTGFVLRPVLGTAAATVGIIGSVKEIALTNPGTGYSSVPTVTISGGSGTGATAYAKVVGAVTSIDILDGGYGYTGTPTAVVSNGEGIGSVLKPTISSGVVTSCAVEKGGSNYVLTKFSVFTVGSVLVDEAGRDYTVTSAQTNNKKNSLIVKSNSGYPLTGIVKLRKRDTSFEFYTKSTVSQKLVESRFPTACYSVTGVFDTTKVPTGSTMTVTDQTNGDKYYRVISSIDLGSGYGRLLLQPLNGGRINTNMVVSGPVTFTVTERTEPDFDSRTGDVLTIANSSTEFTQNQDQTLSFRTVINF